MALFEGSGVAIVTPFDEHDNVNYKKLEELINWHIAEGTDAVITCGTTGETPTLTDREHRDIIKFTVEVVGKRIPVIAGTGSNNTIHCIDMSQFAESVGADGVLVMNPYYNKSTQRGIVAHFNKIADNIDIPIVVYNVPSRTGVNITPNTMVELSKHQNIVAVKEASGNIVQIAETARQCGEEFTIYCGNDDHVVPVLSLGGKGVISVSANIVPADVHEMVKLYLEGNTKESLKMQLKMNGLNRALFIESNPIPIKAAMNILGMDVGHTRMPLITMEDENLEYLKSEMKSYGLI